MPIVTHVHGAVGVADDSDGYAEAWYLPAAKNIPPGYARNGTWFRFFAAKAAGSYGVGWGPGSAVFQYPNENRASTIWYHDHALGMTRLNVYAGPAGFYIVRGGPAGDDAVIDSRTRTQAVLPGPAPTANDKFPPNKPYDEIPIAIQDRSFNSDGSLFYPGLARVLRRDRARLHPGQRLLADLEPRVLRQHDHGQRQHVAVPTVEQRRYRFRFLNGCQSRFLILDFGGSPRRRGLADRQRGRLPRRAGQPDRRSRQPAADGPGRARRRDRRLHQCPVGNYVLANVGPDEPFGGGVPGDDFDVADPGTTGQILQFRVVPAVGVDDRRRRSSSCCPRSRRCPRRRSRGSWR